ncbi:MAG: xylan 1,4-beta-xylosidase [Oscillospiraceae bacterium]|nr:xylan 1,4-beta-xylosidase [Oscillospiraceae bacterium]
MDEKRFVRIFGQSGFGSGIIEVWMDRATGVQYLYRREGYSGGLTVLVDREGKPVTGGMEDWK